MLRPCHTNSFNKVQIGEMFTQGRNIGHMKTNMPYICMLLRFFNRLGNITLYVRCDITVTEKYEILLRFRLNKFLSN